MGLLDKFRNKPFPECMRSMKSAEQIEKEQQDALESVKNVPPLYDWSQIRQAPVINGDKVIQDINRKIERRHYNRFILRTSLRHTVDPIRAELQNFIKNPLKLKLSAGLKRKLRRDKAKYKQVREWLDDAEKAVNEELFEDRR